jgi:PAS domain S-box-containing protein
MTRRLARERTTVGDQFRLLVDAVRDYAIFLLDPEGQVVSWNAGAERIKGYSADEILGESFARFYEPADVAAGKPQAVLREAAAQGRFAGRGWRVRKDGTRFYAHVVVTALRDESGTLQGFAKVTQDVTEQRRQQEELEASAARFQTTVEHLQDPLAILAAVRDDDGRLVDFRYEYVNLAHATQDQVPQGMASAMGHQLLELHPEAEASGLLEAYRAVVETDEPLIWDAFVGERTVGGRRLRRVLDLRVSKLDDGLLITWRDVTERLRTQRQLEEARFQEELHQRLQASLLPAVSMHDPAVQLITRYLPGGQRALLGADFYDTLQLADGTIAVLLGDVAGHGPDEASVGVALRIAWRSMVLTDHEAPDLLVGLDRVLAAERRNDELYATVVCIWVSPDRRRATVALAGHPPPLLIRHGRVSVVEAPCGLALGIDGVGEAWQSATVELGEEWLLLCYTDGLIEGRIAPGTAERFGVERLVEHLEALGGEQVRIDDLLDRILGVVQRANGGQLSDDVAIVCIGMGH